MPAHLLSTRAGSAGETEPGQPAIIVLGATATTGLLLGVLTAFAQGWLPDQVRSLANSSGAWALTAFLLALTAHRLIVAATSGMLALGMLLTGYLAGALAQGDPASRSLVVFWLAAAVLTGPILGWSAHAVRFRRGLAAAAGAGALTGVLIGEGIYGLTVIGATTSAVYWWGQIIAGLLALLAFAAWNRDPRTMGIAVALGACVAGLFIAVYSQDLIGLL